MNLGDKLRHAEEYLGAERVRAGTRNVEANLHNLNLRGKPMRAKPGSAHPDPGRERDNSPQPKVRTGIVSVNGRDVGEMHCTGGRHSG